MGAHESVGSLASCALCAALLSGCKHEAEIRGTVQQAGRGVPRTAITLDCPDRPKVTTTTSATGEFRFEDLGAGAPDDCIVEVDGHGSWIAPLRLGSRCTQHDATSGLCTEARFAFEMP